LVTILIGPLLSIIDFFIVNVALPTIDRDLGASPATLELLVAGYGIAYALLLVLGGRLGDAFGRRRLFLAGMAAFGITSLLCGLAPSIEFLVVARVAQGASAAFMVPQVLSTIQATMAGNQRARALGAYGATAGLSMVIGQLVGGALVSADLWGTDWRPIFLVNVPVAAVGLVLAARLVPETRSSDPARVDLPGTLLLGAAVPALLLPLMEGRSAGWPAWMLALLATFPVLAATFAGVERRIERSGRAPLLPPSLLRLASMRRGLCIGVLFFSGFGGFMFVMAVALQQGAGLSPFGAGAALVSMAVGFTAASLASSRLVERYGRRVVAVGAVLQGLGLTGLAVTILAVWPDLTPPVLAPAMAVAGFGQGLIAPTLFRVILSQVPPVRAGAGSGVLVTTQQVSLALGVATLGSLFLSLSTGPGMRQAVVTVLLIQTFLALLVALLTRRLPNPDG
jgi:MFS family permease